MTPTIRLTLMTIFVALTLISAALGAQTASAPAPGLRFGWSETAAVVDTEYLHEASRGDMRQQVVRMHMTHRMRVLKHEEGHAVEYSDHSLIESSGDAMHAINWLLPLWVPRSIVDRDGRFLRIERAAELRDIAAEIVEPQLRTAEQLPVFRQLLEKIATEAGLRQLAAEDWNLLVGNWITTSPTMERTVTEGKAPVPGGGTVPSTIALAAIERRGCTRDAKPRECVTLEYRMNIDGLQMAAALKAALAGQTGVPAIPVYMDYERLIRVTLETATMLPHELTMTQRSRQERDENGARVVLGDLARRVTRFEYER